MDAEDLTHFVGQAEIQKTGSERDACEARALHNCKELSYGQPLNTAHKLEPKE
jgi:hypothetical protein